LRLVLHYTAVDILYWLLKRIFSGFYRFPLFNHHHPEITGLSVGFGGVSPGTTKVGCLS
jgi:hypothetical protein